MTDDALIRLRRACALGALTAAPAWLAMGLPRLVLWSAHSWFDRVVALPLLALAVGCATLWRHSDLQAKDLRVPVPDVGSEVTRSSVTKVVLAVLSTGPFAYVERSWWWGLLAVTLLGAYLVLLTVAGRAQRRLGVGEAPEWEAVLLRHLPWGPGGRRRRR